jgi:hypothetical protein
VQDVPAEAKAQAPLPLQKPVRPQVVAPAAHSLSGSVLALIAAHCPVAAPVLAWTQAWQVPVQPPLQQMPSAQKPELH